MRSRLDRVRLLLLRDELRTEQAALTESLRSVEAALEGVEKLLALRDAAIVAAVQSGEGQKNVAARYGITQQRVSQIVARNVIDLLPDPEHQEGS